MITFKSVPDSKKTIADSSSSSKDEALNLRESTGPMGQNWSESPEAAKKGRYSHSDPGQSAQADDELSGHSEAKSGVDTDVSEAV